MVISGPRPEEARSAVSKDGRMLRILGHASRRPLSLKPLARLRASATRYGRAPQHEGRSQSVYRTTSCSIAPKIEPRPSFISIRVGGAGFLARVFVAACWGG